MITPKKSLTVRSEVKNIRKVVSELVDFATDKTGMHAGFLPIVLSEAITNAIVHGNRNDPEKEVIAEVRVKPEKLIFTIADEGKGFNFRRRYDPTKGDNVNKASGRGLFLVRHFMDRVSFRHSGRVIIMEKCLN
jgi:serine/threonine-protein kinase RsbW